MTTIVDVDATWVNPNTVQYNAVELRLADAAMFAGRGDTFGARGGIVRHSDTALQVSVDGSDVVTVKAGSVVIPGTAVTGTGVWRTGIGSDRTASLAARDATNARIDLVVFRQLDTDVVGSHGAYTARLEIITGTPSATPAVPSLPTMAIELGRINVPASGGGTATADLTKRQFTAAIGGTIAVPTAAQLPAAAAKWQRAVAVDTGVEYSWTGTTWIMVGTSATAADLFTGNEGHILGSTPPAGTRKLRKQASVIITTAAGGGFDITYHDGAFPNGIVSMMCMPGDNTIAGCNVVPILANCTLGNYNGVAYTGSGAAVSAGAGIRLNYMAVGW